MRTAFIILLTLAPGTLVRAQAMSSTKGLVACESALNNETCFDSIYCTGAVSSVIELSQLDCQLKNEGGIVLFASGDVPSLLAGIQAFVNWARVNPSSWDLPLASNIATAISETFPCWSLTLPIGWPLPLSFRSLRALPVFGV